MGKHLRRNNLLDEEDDEPQSELAALTASAVSGVSSPAGPEFRRGALPMSHVPITFDKPLCAALDGFTLHAATRAGALDLEGREALLKYVLRPSVAQERVTHASGGLVRITLKRPFSDGTVAVAMDPLSLLCRLAASVRPPRFHTVRYAGVLAPASKLRPRIIPEYPQAKQGAATDDDDKPLPKGSRYRPWAELLKRTFLIDVLCCPKCQGRMELIAMVTDPKSVTRFLRALGEHTEPPERVPARGPPYWQSAVLRKVSLPGAA